MFRQVKRFCHASNCIYHMVHMSKQAISGFACVFTGTGLVLAGGNPDSSSRTKWTYFFNMTSGQWRQLGDMTVERSQLNLAYMKVKI